MSSNRFSVVRFLLIFSLLMFFALIVTAAEINIQAGTSAISTALVEASAGDILILSTDGGLYHETGTVIIDKAVIIKADTNLITKTTWTSDNTAIMILFKDELTMDGIIFYGSEGSSATT